MRFFAFYKNSGEVHCVVACHEEAQPVGDLIIKEIPAFVSATSGWITNDQWIPYSPEGAMRLQDMPKYRARWSPADESWIDLRSDEERVAAQWRVVREERNRLLEASDWTDTLSARTRLGSERYEAWQVYRQLLRDVTLQSDPYAIVWPEPPQSA